MNITGEYSKKRILIFSLISFSVPLLFLVLVFIIPEPFSWPIIKSASWVIDSFQIEAETYRALTLFVFGRLTPNYAPIQIAILFILLFTFTFIILVMYNYASRRYKNA